MLDVAGPVIFRDGATPGYVLTSDADGLATWQEQISLPYDGTVSHTAAAFKVANTGAGMGAHAIYAEITNPSTSSDAAAGVFRSTGTAGKAVYARADGASAVEARNDGPSPTLRLRNDGSGHLIEGKVGPDVMFRVTSDGTAEVNALQINGGADLSERFDVRGARAEPEPGMVVCIDRANPGKLVLSTQAYDRTVAGIISGAGGVKTGMMMGQSDSLADGDQPVALTGRVYVRAEVSNGPIVPGDLLTTSDVPGHAMKVTDYGRSHGAVLGKAMTSLEQGTGLVLVLVSLQQSRCEKKGEADYEKSDSFHATIRPGPGYRNDGRLRGSCPDDLGGHRTPERPARLDV